MRGVAISIDDVTMTVNTYRDGEISCNFSLVNIYQLGDADQQHSRWAGGDQDEQEPVICDQRFLRKWAGET